MPICMSRADAFVTHLVRSVIHSSKLSSAITSWFPRRPTTKQRFNSYSREIDKNHARRLDSERERLA